jgi:hypothetical protein
MKRSIGKFVGMMALVALVGAFSFTRMKAQEAGSAKDARVGTNWVGYLVYGKDDPALVGRGPYPTAERQVQIGLRSDGVVVWRASDSAITSRPKGELK